MYSINTNIAQFDWWVQKKIAFYLIFFHSFGSFTGISTGAKHFLWTDFSFSKQTDGGLIPAMMMMMIISMHFVSESISHQRAFPHPHSRWQNPYLVDLMSQFPTKIRSFIWFSFFLFSSLRVCWWTVVASTNRFVCPLTQIPFAENRKTGHPMMTWAIVCRMRNEIRSNCASHETMWHQAQKQRPTTNWTKKIGSKQRRKMRCFVRRRQCCRMVISEIGVPERHI